MTVTFRSNMPAFLASLPGAINELVLESAEEVAKGVIEAMDEGKSGIKYPNLPNVSSAPGEAPATQSGDYAASVKAEPNGDGKAAAHTDAVQAARLEYGDKHVAMRPNWVKEAAKEAKEAEARGARKALESAKRAAL